MTTNCSLPLAYSLSSIIKPYFMASSGFIYIQSYLFNLFPVLISACFLCGVALTGQAADTSLNSKNIFTKTTTGNRLLQYPFECSAGNSWQLSDILGLLSQTRVKYRLFKFIN
jgi:hypothetical protein